MKKYSVIMLCIILFASCATGPNNFKQALSTSNEFALFPSGALYYGYIDKAKSKTLYNTFFSDTTITDAAVRKMLDKTEKILFAYYHDKDTAGLLALLRGKAYPVVSSALAFSFNPEWEKITTKDGVYWRSKKSKNTLAFQNNAALVSVGDVPFNREAVNAPPAFSLLRQNAAAAAWLPSASFLDALLANNNIPVVIPAKQILFAALPTAWGIEITLHFETESSVQAKLIASLWTLIRKNRNALDPALWPLVDIIAANPPEVQGRTAIITTAPLSEEDAAALILLLLG